jgi:hypothetical protein
VHHQRDLPSWKEKTTKQKKLGEKVACLCVFLCSFFCFFIKFSLLFFYKKLLLLLLLFYFY